MVPFLPKQLAIKASITYLAALATVSILFMSHAMDFRYILLGLIFVLGFFFWGSNLSKNWTSTAENCTLKRIFLLAVSLRLVWVFFSYYYYNSMTGQPFEFGAADALGYHEEAKWLAGLNWSSVWQYYFGPDAQSISDVGYPLYLTFLYKLFGPVIIIPRALKAFISAYTCVLIFRLASRSFGKEAGMVSGIMCALMPNLIIYCGYHLKETEMLFLEVAFLERADYLLRTRAWNFTHILVPFILAASLFFFRTVLGAAAAFSFVSAILLANTPTMKKGWKRASLIGWVILAIAVAGGSIIMTEIEAMWEEKDDNAAVKRIEQTERGNKWAKYATGTVMAPMAFVLPFSTMVNTDQQFGQQEKHSGNFIRNFMGIFAFLAVYEAIRRKRWRDFTLIGAFLISYLGVVALSGFSNSERFLLPGLPCLIMMWAYGISTLRTQTWRLITPWCLIVIFMELAWAFFKLGSRGLF